MTMYRRPMKQRPWHLSVTLAFLSLALVAVALPRNAQGALEVREEAFELEAGQILRWPLRAGDSLVVRPCDDCDVTTLQVTEETRYSLGFNGEPLTLRDLLRMESLNSSHDNSLIIVFFRPNNGPVTRIILQTEL